MKTFKIVVISLLSILATASGHAASISIDTSASNFLHTTNTSVNLDAFDNGWWMFSSGSPTLVSNPVAFAETSTGADISWVGWTNYNGAAQDQTYHTFLWSDGTATANNPSSPSAYNPLSGYSRDYPFGSRNPTAPFANGTHFTMKIIPNNTRTNFVTMYFADRRNDEVWFSASLPGASFAPVAIATSHWHNFVTSVVLAFNFKADNATDPLIFTISAYNLVNGDTAETGRALHLPNAVAVSSPFTGAELTWVGGGGNTWDTSSSAWTNLAVGGSLVAYAEGDRVTFSDLSPNPSVSLTGVRQPDRMTVNNNANAFTLTGGGLSGSMRLIKQGTNSLTFSSMNNTYSGGTYIESGALAGTQSSIQGLLSVNGAVEITTTAEATNSSSISGNGLFTKKGASRLALNGDNSLSGKFFIDAGTLAVETAASGSAAYDVAGSGTLEVVELDNGQALTASSLSFAAGANLRIGDGAFPSSTSILQTAALTNLGTVTVTYSGAAVAPGTVVLIDYDDTNSIVGSYALAPLGAGYTASVVHNTSNTSIDLVVTAVPVKTWTGGIDNSWDAATANWNSNPYSDGDSVKFTDAGANTDPITVSSDVLPKLVWLDNSTKTYSFDGSGVIVSPVLVKSGAGTLKLRSTGAVCDFSLIDLQAGVLSYEYQAFLPPLAVTESADIKGSGTLQVNLGSTDILTLSGNNGGFDGDVAVNTGILRLGGNGVLGSGIGSTTIANGSAMDVNGNFSVMGEQVIVSGAGPDSASGVIVNNAAAAGSFALSHVTLAGSTTFGGTAGWEIRGSDSAEGMAFGILDTTGAQYSLTKVGTNVVGLRALELSSGIGDITIQSGTLSFLQQSRTNMGDPTKTLTVKSGAIVQFRSGLDGIEAPFWNKRMRLESGSLLDRFGTGGNVTFLGPVELAGPGTVAFSVSSGKQMTLSGEVTDNGSAANINLTGNGTSVLSGVNSLSGNININGITDNLGRCTLKLSTQTTLSGALVCSTANAIGAVVTAHGTTLTFPSLTLGSGTGNVGLAFDLGALGNPTAPVMSASVLSPNAETYTVTVTAGANTLSPGTVDLLQYPVGSFPSTLAYTLPAGVVGYVTNNTALSKIQLVIAPTVVTDPPPVLTNVVAGGQIQLTWGSGYRGYILQSQTNSLVVGLSNNWTSILTTETTTGYTQAVDILNPTVFFRLVYTNAP